MPFHRRFPLDRSTRRPELPGPILIRRSRILDATALRRLADLDSRTLPAGSFLLAEVGDELVAAAPLDVDEKALADPFKPTADIRELLDLRARQLRLQNATLDVAA